MVKKFVYQLGAGRFDEYLAAEVEESMRNFINTIWLSQVFDLKSDMANNMMSELNRTFDGKFGIRFEQCNVTNVTVNPNLLASLQERTRLKFELKNHQKDHAKRSQHSLTKHLKIDGWLVTYAHSLASRCSVSLELPYGMPRFSIASFWTVQCFSLPCMASQ